MLRHLPYIYSWLCFRTQETYNEFWQAFDHIIGIDTLKVIHINDSKKELGSRIDRHEHIGKGK